MRRRRKPFQNLLCHAHPPMPLYYLSPRAAAGCIRYALHEGPHRNRDVEWSRDLRYPADISDLTIRATGEKAKP